MRAIRRSAIRHQRHLPSTCSPQPAAALRQMKAPRSSRLLNQRQSAYQTKGLKFRLDESSVAGHRSLGKIEEKDWISIYEKSGLEARQRMHVIWQHVFAAKPSEWKYEGERRLLVQTRTADTQPIRHRCARSAVKELIIGERMPPDFQERLLALMHKYYAGTPIKTARRAEGQYTLAFT